MSNNRTRNIEYRRFRCQRHYLVRPLFRMKDKECSINNFQCSSERERDEPRRHNDTEGHGDFSTYQPFNLSTCPPINNLSLLSHKKIREHCPDFLCMYSSYYFFCNAMVTPPALIVSTPF